MKEYEGGTVSTYVNADVKGRIMKLVKTKGTRNAVLREAIEKGLQVLEREEKKNGN